MSTHLRIVGHGTANTMTDALVAAALVDLLQACGIALAENMLTVEAVAQTDGQPDTLVGHYTYPGICVALHVWPGPHRYMLDVMLVHLDPDLRLVLEALEKHMGRGPRTAYDLSHTLKTPQEIKNEIDAGGGVPPTALDAAGTVRYVEALKELKRMQVAGEV